jgi:hypothetical protein
MARVVASVAPSYQEMLQWKTVVTKELKGALRYCELTKKLGRPAPVPSIFINGELVFDRTPSEELLRDHLDRLCRRL